MLRRAVIWTFAGQGASFLFSFGSSIAVARLLSPYELGIYAVAMAVVGMLQVVASFGVAMYVVREAELTPATMDTAFTVNALLALALALLIMAAATPAALFLKTPPVARILVLLALSPLIGIPAFRSGAMLEREMRFGEMSLLGVLGTATTAIATVTAAATGASYMSPAYGSIVSSLIGSAATMAVAPRHIGFRLSLAGWRPIARFGTQVMSISGLAVAVARLTDILLGRLIGVTALGLLSRASNLSNMVYIYVYGGAMRVTFPQLAKDFRETGTLRHTFITSMKLITAVVGPIIIGMAILSRPIVYILYGQKWLSVAPLLSLLMMGQYMILTFAMSSELYMIRDRVATQIKLETSRSVVGLISSVIASIGGVVWVAASSAADQIFSMVLYLPQMARLTDSTNRELIGLYGEALLLALVTGFPSLMLMIWQGWSPHVPIVDLIGAVLSGGVLWLTVLAYRAHPLWTEIRYFGALGLAKLRVRAS